MIQQLAHLCFYTNQLDRMVAFYRDGLGCPVKFTMRNDDGFEFGFGAEIGISTDRLHARGPMGLPELCSYKFIIEGTGQVRG